MQDLAGLCGVGAAVHGIELKSRLQIAVLAGLAGPALDQ